MKPYDEKALKWELARERFRIEQRNPPAAQRQEKPIGEILQGVLKRETEQPAPLPAELKERWPAIAGAQLAQHAQPVYLINGILQLYVDHPGWLTELKRIPKNHLLKRIGTIPGLPAVKDLRFQLDPSIQTNKKPAFQGRPPDRKKN